MQQMLGLVPSFFKTMPDTSLDMEWQLMKQVQMMPGAIPNKYRELLGVGISAVTKCKYCAFFHTEMAKISGATDAEIEDAVHYAKSSAGWSAYINGMQTDFEQFKREILQACKHVKAMQGK
jgi:AhpD family alkylhydroperoxidase